MLRLTAKDIQALTTRNVALGRTMYTMLPYILLGITRAEERYDSQADAINQLISLGDV